MAEVSLLTIMGVQEITQLGRTTIYELMRDGVLPYLKVTLQPVARPGKRA